MVGTAVAFWMRSVRAWATAGVSLRPSAPSVPRAAVMPPENLTKSRRDSAPREPRPASSLGGGTGAAIGEKDPPTGIVETPLGVVNIPSYRALLLGANEEAYTAFGRAGI